MGSLAALLGTFASSLGSRVLVSLGLGFISFASYSAAANLIISNVQANWSGIGSDVLAYLSLAGFPTGFGMILGAVVMRLSLTQLTTIGKIS